MMKGDVVLMLQVAARWMRLAAGVLALAATMLDALARIAGGAVNDGKAVGDGKAAE